MKILATWMVFGKSNKFFCHCLENTLYGEIEGSEIEFGKNGHWPLKDFTYVKPDLLGDLAGWLSAEHSVFASKNGMYVFFVKPVKVKVKSLKKPFSA